MTTPSFPLQQWYVAAFGSEVGRTPLARTVCNEPLVMFRRRDNSVAALDDRCPHRFYQLSRGQLVDDDIECGYHGLRFDGTGACTHIPAQTQIPAGFGARSFPAVERSGLLYVWMGEPVRADRSLIPDFPENGGEAWAASGALRHVEANYQLVVDNLLDLTHLTFVHKTTLAGPGIQENPLDVRVDGDRVIARREMRGVDLAPIFRTLRHFPGKIDRYQNITFIPPSHVHIRIEATPAGANDDPDLVHHVVLNHLTPETERTTHYFWSICRRMRIDDAAIGQRLFEMNRAAFDEDADVLKHQQAMIDRDPARAALANLDADKATVAARRIVRRKIEAEKAKT
ncbi:MAG TPA: aromatic ring-hydroxylating dioxygenase subunit alpha [Xanthobacteraceae bacterium]|jgi:vanillate monooxygenase|nr:aromatic ring-hydroxylating dioxygenase subunit alpha [Xanthobacteraceae bacterium]